MPSPIAEAARALQAVEGPRARRSMPTIRQSILDHAQEAARLWPPRVGSLPWITALNDAPEGTARFLSQAFKASGHELEETDAEQLAEDCSDTELGDVIRVCLHGEMPAPKSTASTETAPKNWLAETIRSRLTSGALSSGESTNPPDGAPTKSSTLPSLSSPGGSPKASLRRPGSTARKPSKSS